MPAIQLRNGHVSIGTDVGSHTIRNSRSATNSLLLVSNNATKLDEIAKLARAGQLLPEPQQQLTKFLPQSTHQLNITPKLNLESLLAAVSAASSSAIQTPLDDAISSYQRAQLL